MDGSGRGTAMICLPVVHFNDGRIDGRLNAASATTFHALPRKTSEVGLSLILPLPPSASKDSAGGEGSIPLLIGNLSFGVVVVVDLKVVI